ncbi:nicotinate (nicotinamide) nucleotide adenylyltransferase [Thermocrinis albus DSM 14484]|uniref:Probable nicotinate-nucleotide adenylyltransferase n=1 Tax=Thermocrinis albus (strain DSM 14484 / JCM 11386 / HI 11/12) TaxID=638303 RepID=D3SPR6_THEAH|nr:nicotinate-nucleotide adenylyltransferase [Thermocrinis albus]ADC89153.1 nicotinate (nicotinamide) nucleotide adenylyltransferase [Thermocrinis albus DSM 14484]
MKVLFFGGSFDPVHVGHLVVARDVMELLGFDEVVFVPAFQAPLKAPHEASPFQRLRMLEIALEGKRGFSVSDIEIRRGGVSYTVDTAEEIFKKMGERPYFLLGADSVLHMHLWKEPNRLLKMARFVIVDREGKKDVVRDYLRTHYPSFREGEDFTVIAHTRRIDVSSTEIRKRVKEGKPISWLVPEGVEEYIYRKGLYR